MMRRSKKMAKKQSEAAKKAWKKRGENIIKRKIKTTFPLRNEKHDIEIIINLEKQQIRFKRQGKKGIGGDLWFVYELLGGE